MCACSSAVQFVMEVGFNELVIEGNSGSVMKAISELGPISLVWAIL